VVHGDGGQEIEGLLLKRAVTPLSYGVRAYDFMANNGPQNLGSWIDRACLLVTQGVGVRRCSDSVSFGR
jgi:hypothetical protein